MQQGDAAAATAAEVLRALDGVAQVLPFSDRDGGLDLDHSYAVTAALRALRVARGERHVGRKIGFTNRTIWDEYNVYAPIWGDMYDSTVGTLAGPVSLGKFCEPRIEPEIVLGLKSAPRADMDERALLGCVGWIGHGFEIVQSLFHGWKFSAADCVAGAGLHGAYLIGARQAVDDVDTWLAALAAFEIELMCNGTVVDRGHARNVLDGPLSALKHLVELLAVDAHNPPLGASEVITTGTVTRAFPIAPGERWQTRVIGLPLAGLDVTFSP